MENRVIIFLGPTCVGKTGVSILLAKALNTEIISADSMQVYRNMDIGTAKPSSNELKEVKHHLINILSPSKSFSAGLFKKMATKIIDDLHRKNKIPIIVGGTGLYIKTLTRGLFEGPSADWQLREKLLEEEKLYGREYLYKKLKKIDPESARKINPGDVRRIIRALEVSMKAEKPISEFQQLKTAPQHYKFIKIGLLRDREELYRLIEQRVDKMMERGLLQETQRLLKMNPHRIPLQSLGYKEMSLYLDGFIKIEEVIRLLKKRTKRYAKRQFTWFKKEPGIKWVNITEIIEPQEIFKKIIKDAKILKELIHARETKKPISYS